MKRKQELSNIFLSVFFYSILSRNAPHISRKTFGGIEIWHRTIFSHFPNLLFIDPQPHLTVVRAPGRGKLKPFLSEVENLNLELSSPFSRIKVFYLLNIEVFLKPTSLLWEQMVRKKKSTRVLVANLAFCKKIDDQIQHLGGAFENNFVPGEWKFEWTNPLKLKCSGGCPGGMLKLQIDWHITFKFTHSDRPNHHSRNFCIPISLEFIPISIHNDDEKRVCMWVSSFLF